MRLKTQRQSRRPPNSTATLLPAPRVTSARITPNSESVLRRAGELLAKRYGTPRLGNKRNPISELVFIILSARTGVREHETAYRRLRRRFPTWPSVRDAALADIRNEIRDAGLSQLKARQIRGALRKIDRDFGVLSLGSLRKMDVASMERYLTSLPGVGVKTARCVMLYSLEQSVFPADTHCIRLFCNLGVLGASLRFEYAQEPLQRIVPADLRYSLHVNAVAHGRLVCRPRAPRCDECAIRHLCINRAG